MGTGKSSKRFTAALRLSTVCSLNHIPVAWVASALSTTVSRAPPLPKAITGVRRPGLLPAQRQSPLLLQTRRPVRAAPCVGDSWLPAKQFNVETQNTSLPCHQSDTPRTTRDANARYQRARLREPGHAYPLNGAWAYRQSESLRQER